MLAANMFNNRDNIRINVAWRRGVCVCVCVCVCVALVIQRAMRMRSIFICGLSALQYISTLPQKLHDFRKKLLNTKCVF